MENFEPALEFCVIKHGVAGVNSLRGLLANQGGTADYVSVPFMGF